MTAPTKTEQPAASHDQAGGVASVTELAVSKPCREELHLWCKGKAGQHGRRLCGCTCHDEGRPIKTKTKGTA